MKKLFIIIVALLMLNGCNYQAFDLEYHFDKVVCYYGSEKMELSIDKWTDYEGEQIQVKSNGKVYLLSANRCYLVEE